MGSTCQTWWYSIRVRLSRLRARVGNNFEIVRSGGKKKNIGEKVLNNFQKGEEHSSFYFFEIKNHQTIFPICISIVYIYIHVYRDTRSRKTIFIINIYIYIYIFQKSFYFFYYLFNFSFPIDDFLPLIHSSSTAHGRRSAATDIKKRINAASHVRSFIRRYTCNDAIRKHRACERERERYPWAIRRAGLTFILAPRYIENPAPFPCGYRLQVRVPRGPR